MSNDYLQQKKELLERFFSISLQIQARVEKEEAESLEELFLSRDNLIHEIKELDQQTDPTLVDLVKKELSPLVKKMIEQEHLLKQIVTTKKAQAQCEIKKLNLSKQMNKAYQQNHYATDGIFFDKTINPNK